MAFAGTIIAEAALAASFTVGRSASFAGSAPDLKNGKDNG
jgi:hypothetical protein